MKILNVTFSKGVGGLETSFIDYTKSIALGGNEVISIIHPKAKISPEGKYIKISAFSKHDPIACLKIAYIINKEKPDLIITHGNKAHSLISIACTISINKTKRIGVCHSGGFNIIKKSDYIISVGQNLLADLINSGFNPNKTSCINNAIELDSNKNTNKLPSKNHTIGFLGRFDNCKGLDLFIKALSILKSKDINIKAIIGGDGEEKHKLIQMAKDYHIEDSINMIGWITDKEKFFSEIDILCVPSRMESFGIVILEAMKYGVPVIASNVSGPSEIITDNSDGLLFKSEDVEDFSNKIEKLYKDDELWEKLQSNGYKTVTKYDINSVSKQLNETFKKWAKQ